MARSFNMKTVLEYLHNMNEYWKNNSEEYEDYEREMSVEIERMLDTNTMLYQMFIYDEKYYHKMEEMIKRYAYCNGFEC